LNALACLGGRLLNTYQARDALLAEFLLGDGLEAAF
jgi:hypothetical protein